MAARMQRPAAGRLNSLDQFRGYTVAGMFLVNFLGGYAVIDQQLPLLKHGYSYCSYADTIMPQFFFAVGFAFRLTFGRRVQTLGAAAAYGRVVRRLLGLVLIALVVYTVGERFPHWSDLRAAGISGVLAEPLKRNWFQTLMHIAVTSLWVLPVIGAGAAVRVSFLIASAVLHVYLSYLFNFHWVNTGANGIDGGPLGFLTWTIPLLVGSLACDAVVQAAPELPVKRLLTWAAALMALGYLFSCPTTLYDLPAEQAGQASKLAASPVIPTEPPAGQPRRWQPAEPPFVRPPSDPTETRGNPGGKRRQWNYWMMSQARGTLSYLTFSAGFSLAVYVLFLAVCDGAHWQLGIFRTLGVNALAGYILHEMVGSAVKPFVPADAPGWYVAGGFAVFFGLTYLFLRHLEREEIFLRL